MSDTEDVASIDTLKKQLEKHDEQIAYLEEHMLIDYLTGVKNRRAFEWEFETALKLVRGEILQHRVGATPLTEISLIMLDLDHFKHINDTFGHSVGDEALRKTSALLLDLVRDTDMVARYGGEEFMILLRGVGESFAIKKAEEIRAKIENLTFDIQPELKVTASFGVVSSKSSTDATVLKNIVDETLYKAKENGRNRVEVYKNNQS
jgi:diguanylate cyclase (GGDEF)-like protein